MIYYIDNIDIYFKTYNKDEIPEQYLTIDTHIDIPEINSVKDAYEFLRHCKTKDDLRTFPMMVIQYVKMKSEDHIELYKTQLFNRYMFTTDITSEVEPTEYVGDKPIYYTFAVPENAEKLYNALLEDAVKCKSGIIIPIPTMCFLPEEHACILSEEVTSPLSYDQYKKLINDGQPTPTI